MSRVTGPPGDVLGGLLDEGGPPATAAGLAAVVGRRHALGRRRLQLSTMVALAATGAMAGLLAAGTPGSSVAAGRPRPPVAAAPLQAPTTRRPHPTAPGPAPASGSGPPPASRRLAPAAAPAVAPGAGSSPEATRRLSAVFRGRLGGVDVRAYAEQAPGRPLAPSAQATCGGGALVLEVSDAAAVGRLVVSAGPANGGLAGAATTVVGAAEGQPFEVAAARLPVGAASATARFGPGPRVVATVRDGWAMAVDPAPGRAGVPVVLVAVGAGGRHLARVVVAPGAATGAAACRVAGGASGR